MNLSSVEGSLLNISKEYLSQYWNLKIRSKFEMEPLEIFDAINNKVIRVYVSTEVAEKCRTGKK